MKPVTHEFKIMFLKCGIRQVLYLTQIKLHLFHKKALTEDKGHEKLKSNYGYH